MRAKKYNFVCESTNLKLTKDVNKLLKEGWEIHGYPIIQDGMFFQCMIKITSNKNDKEITDVNDKE